MFKGIKNALKGGFSPVAEQGSNLASSVSGDPELRASKFKDQFKEKLQGGTALVSEGSEEIQHKVSDSKVEDAGEKAKEVAHNIKHYGAFGEDYLGYSDPTKDLRKAVKEKSLRTFLILKI